MAEEKNEEIKKAATLVEEISMDPKEREIYEARLMAKYNYDSGMAGARQAGMEEGLEDGKKIGIEQGRAEGIEQGIKKGQKEKQIQIAKKLKKMGMAEKEIEEATGLTEEEIQKLDNE